MKTKVRKIRNSRDSAGTQARPENSPQVTQGHEHFDEIMKIAESVMKRYPNALRELAK